MMTNLGGCLSTPRATASCAFAGDSGPSVMAQPVMMGQPVMAQAQPVQQPQMQMMQVQVRQPTP